MITRDAFRTKVTLVGKQVRLEPLTVQWLEPTLRTLADPEVLRLTGTRTAFTREQITTWLSTRADQTDRADWAVVRISDGTYLGETAVVDFDPDNASANFRIALAGPDMFGRGYGTEATRLVMDYVFRVIGLHRLGLDVFAFNERAAHVYGKCGFVHEGRLREAHEWDGQRHDVILMGAINPHPKVASP